MLNMRPPIQSTTLQQQNEGSRQQLQQQQQQLSTTKISDTPLHIQQQQLQQQQIARKTKLPQHDILVEQHLNSTHSKSTSIARKRSTPNAAAAAAAETLTKTITTISAEPKLTTTYQTGSNLSLIQNAKQRSNRLRNHNNDTPNDDIVNIDYEEDVNVHDDSIQLVDLSTSPPSPLILSLPVARHASEPQRAAVVNAIATAPAALTEALPIHTQRSSIISDCQYSAQSSTSSDDISLNTGEHLYHYSSRANTFDDVAKHFIINFPAADSFLTHNQNDCVINLPLSETEPLLTNIEATVADKQRSICLNKNSASLIFTKKELPTSNFPTSTSVNERRYFTPTNNNFQQQQHHQEQQSLEQQKQEFTGKTGPKHSSNNLYTRRCHSLRVASTEKSNRRPTKHLPATYHQQHQQQRRSLQLNYNNNLVTTSTCSSNNNNCCPVALKGSGGAVLHRQHANTSITAAPLTTSTASFNEARTTATATRKQHAYSWYAPVYSALEEELEQDSRESSPIHNLANSKKQHSSSHHQHRSSHKTSTASDNETVALLESRNQINIQAQLHAQSQQVKGSSSSSGGINFNESLPTQHRKTSTSASAHGLSLQLNNGTSGLGSSTTVGQSSNSNETEGPHAGSLGLAGGPLPRRRRLENLEKFFKSLVGLRPSPHGSGSGSVRSGNGLESTQNISTHPMPLPASPEIRITRTPSEQNMDMSDAERQLLRTSTDKLAQPCHSAQGSTSSLNVVQQKLWNIMRREGSAASLHQEKSQSVVQYSGLRKCETVLALTTRQGNPPYSPVYNGGLSPGRGSPQPMSNACSMNQAPYMGSGVFSASGVEQIRPLNRLRNSATSINAATCSRCSSLLSLAATGSRYSLNTTAGAFVNTIPGSVSQQLQPPPPNFSVGAQPLHQRRYTQSMISNRRLSYGKRSRSCSTSSREDTPNDCAGNTCNASSSPSRKTSTCSCTSSSSVSCSRKSSAGAQSATTNSSISPLFNRTAATQNSSLTPSSTTAAASLTSPSATTTLTSTPTTPTITPTANSTTPTKVKHSNSISEHLALPLPTLFPTTKTAVPTGTHDTADGVTLSVSAAATTTETTNSLRPFQMFTCKLCLIDVESVKEATTLVQCGCQFCTECMKAYIEFEISEGAYEISCPDAQCPAHVAITLPEIAKLTTANLMKKHYRYRLNREIELDKSSTWCPRAGCETVCRVRDGDAAPSTSSAANTTPTSPLSGNGNEDATEIRCSVVCPSCKDEFCSACKKTWHPNISCEENSRRLVADGQDDIGIPFDNDLIKCCPMCAVPIEKDEGCAQMMCKRCKHVFCWYCLASLDDDFLLRHYDKGPCKNKLGHSRASVVWHRAQVIGIFAGFGILLLVASPLLLLAAPCIICCKCRSCSGSKIDEADTDLEEATALQS